MAEQTEQFVAQIEREHIAKRLKQARMDMKLTQMELAEKADVGRSTIMHYENAKVAPGAMELLRLSRALEVSPNYILMGKEQFEQPSEEQPLLNAENQVQNTMRLSLCLMVLDQEVRDNFTALLMSMVKARMGKAQYREFLAVLDGLGDSMGTIWPDMEALLDKQLDNGAFSNIEDAVKAMEDDS